jgi:hypothetical protein
MAIFTPALLDVFERLSTGEMPDTFRVLRTPESTFDDLGAEVSGGAPVEADSGSCRIRPLGTPEEREFALQFKQVDAEMLVVPRGTDVRETDTVEVTVARTGETATHAIVGLMPLGSFAVHRKALVRRG